MERLDSEFLSKFDLVLLASRDPTLRVRCSSRTTRSAWRSIRRKAAANDEGEVIYPNLLTCRFHDLRHTAVTTMAEKGLPDLTIMAQVGHVAPQMLRHYSHIRRQAFNLAAAALEPSFVKPQTATVELIN